MKTWQDLTDMATKQECAIEMKKKFYGTLMGIRCDSGEVVYAKYVGYNDDYKHIFQTEEKDKIMLNNDTATQVFIPNPATGVYNTKEVGVIMFNRLPYRQHKRGLCDATASTLKIKYLLEKITNPFQYSEDFNFLIYDVLNDKLQKEVTIEEACKKAMEHASWAINRNFFVTQSIQRDTEFSMFYHSAYLGEILPQEKKIKTIDTPFKQELLDTFRSTNWRIE